MTVTWGGFLRGLSKVGLDCRVGRTARLLTYGRAGFARQSWYLYRSMFACRKWKADDRLFVTHPHPHHLVSSPGGQGSRAPWRSRA